MKRAFGDTDIKGVELNKEENNNQENNIVSEPMKKKSRGDNTEDRVSVNYLNRHPRDLRIAFEDPGHSYYVDGVKIKESVTKIKSIFCPKFDPEGALKCIFEGKSEVVTRADGTMDLVVTKSAKPQYLNKNRWQVLDLWPTTGERGVDVHALIEQYTINLCGQKSIEFTHAEKLAMVDSLNANPTLVPLLHLYIQAESTLSNEGWYPYRAEWNIFHEDYKYAGGADAIYERIDPKTKIKEHCVIDFKVTDNYMKKSLAMFQKNLFYPFDKLRATMLNGYSLQFNLLTLALVEKYGLNVTHQKLLQINHEI